MFPEGAIPAKDVEAPRIIAIYEWPSDGEGARLDGLDQDVQEVLR